VPITADQVDIWRQTPSEPGSPEFKEARAQIDHRQLCKCCVAIANQGERYLVLGITNRLPRKVVGTQACSEVKAQTQKLFESLDFRVNVEVVEHPDR
jgi:ATP-dependent DNA helicase RecG